MTIRIISKAENRFDRAATLPLSVAGRASPPYPLPEFQAIVGAGEWLIGDGHAQEGA